MVWPVELDRELNVGPVKVDLVTVQRRVDERLGEAPPLQRGEQPELTATTRARAAREMQRDRIVEALDAMAPVRAPACTACRGQVEPITVRGFVDDVGELPF